MIFCIIRRMTSTIAPVMSDMRMKPEPTARPMHAVHHSEAAVVRPEILCSDMKIVPAPRKPTPETTDVVIRPMLTPTMEPWLSSSTAAMVCCSIRETSAAPTHTSTCVRMPAGRFLISRSMPIIAPINTAAAMRKSSVPMLSGCPNMSMPFSALRIPSIQGISSSSFHKPANNP